MRPLKLAVAGLIAVGLTGVAHSESAEERAGQLKTWRQQCADPDVDLRTAYIEAAIASKDVAVIRICLRLALESNDADIRNLGLRAAIASISQLTFAATMPPKLAQAYDDAGDNEDALYKISNSYITQIYESVKNGLVFEIKKADVTTGTSTWYPLANLSEANERFKGQATVIGGKVSWVGSASFTKSDCEFHVALAEGAELQGNFQCSNLWKIPVSATLL